MFQSTHNIRIPGSGVAATCIASCSEVGVTVSKISSSVVKLYKN